MAGKKGRIFVISSPSGGGKTTVCNRLRRGGLGLEYSVSATTRPPRSNEKNGRDYIFIDKDEFRRMKSRKRFLEWTNNFGDLYGTPARPVREALSKGRDVILSIDVKGAMQVKRLYRDAVLIFILPPSMGMLKTRLRRRKTENVKAAARRLEVAKREMTYLNRYDYAVVNDDLTEAVNSIKAIIMSERKRIGRG
jgi:guanylate kinase